MVNYCRRFIENYAEIALPLQKLTRNKVPFVWNKDCDKAFQALKNKVTSPPVLAYPDFDKPVQMDSSNFALGAVLMNHDRRPIAFISRSLRKAKLNYHITDLELLAIVWAIKKFNNYLYGQQFICETDHKALEWLFKISDPSSRLMRFRLKLETYNFTIRYIKGKKITWRMHFLE